MTQHMGNELPESLIGILEDDLKGRTVGFVYTLRLPCTIAPLPDGAPEAVIRARSFLHGPDQDLICSRDHRVINILRESVRDSARKHLLPAEEVHLSLALINDDHKKVILLGGMDSRFIIFGESELRLGVTGSRIMEEFKRLITDRLEVSLIDFEQFTEIVAKDPDAFEKALSMKPV